MLFSWFLYFWGSLFLYVIYKDGHVEGPIQGGGNQKFIISKIQEALYSIRISYSLV